MHNQLFLIHERIGNWARHLRPRLSGPALRIVETRSISDIEKAIKTALDPFPTALIDLGRRPSAGLESLQSLLELAPDALVLVIDPESHPELPGLARELGATHVLSGKPNPPEVARLLQAWKRLASDRADRRGWIGPLPVSTEPEPWNWITPMLRC